jgi:hypothetical protein
MQRSNPRDRAPLREPRSGPPGLPKALQAGRGGWATRALLGAPAALVGLAVQAPADRAGRTAAPASCPIATDRRRTVGQPVTGTLTCRCQGGQGPGPSGTPVSIVEPDAHPYLGEPCRSLLLPRRLRRQHRRWGRGALRVRGRRDPRQLPALCRRREHDQPRAYITDVPLGSYELSAPTVRWAAAQPDFPLPLPGHRRDRRVLLHMGCPPDQSGQFAGHGVGPSTRPRGGDRSRSSASVSAGVNPATRRSGPPPASLSP